jgi:hypothetical protein
MVVTPRTTDIAEASSIICTVEGSLVGHGVTGHRVMCPCLFWYLGHSSKNNQIAGKQVQYS